MSADVQLESNITYTLMKEVVATCLQEGRGAIETFKADCACFCGKADLFEAIFEELTRDTDLISVWVPH